MKRLHKLLLWLVAFTAIMHGPVPVAQAKVKLPAIWGSRMVLQRDMPVRIWGWADAGEQVTVSIGKDQSTTKAGQDGRWQAQLSPQSADGKPRTVKVAGSNTIELTDVLVGEVWIGSGQSNMEWRLANTLRAQKTIASATHPNIRLFHVPKVQAKTPADDVKAEWKHCTPQNVPTFSAVLYHFGLQLHDALDVPIGLVNSSWGGSAIEPWLVTDDASGGMYNGMIAPLTPLAARGFIWYQGETNVMRKDGLAYADKMKTLIEGWRRVFRNPELACYFVQIAPWSGRYEPGQLPMLWEAQVATLKIPHTGMAVITDLVDNLADIHPRNKLDVGHRLAIWAFAKNYGRKDVVYSGPLFESQRVEGDKIRISFAHVAGGLKSCDGKPLTEFQIAGADGKFVQAVAEIDGSTILVHAPGVSSPQIVRFGWHKVAQPNLVNSVGLPASPFQTDHWQGGTGQ